MRGVQQYLYLGAGSRTDHHHRAGYGGPPNSRFKYTNLIEHIVATNSELVGGESDCLLGSCLRYVREGNQSPGNFIYIIL